MARERFKEGVQFFDLKQYDKARAAFLQAYALKRHPAVLLNLAQSELRSQHEADAARHFSQYLREHREASDAERQAAEAGLAAARAEVGELVLNVDEEGATVIVDGSTEGQTPLSGPLYLKPGAHTLTVRKDSRDVTSTLILNAGQSSTTTIRLRKSPKATTKPVQESEGAQELEPPTRPSEPSYGLDAETPPAEDVSREREPFFKWAAHSPLAWIGGGIAVLGLGSTVGLWVASQQKYSDANGIADEIRSAAANPPDELVMRVPNGRLETQGICKIDLKQTYPMIAGAPGGSEWLEQFEHACDLYVDSADDGDHLRTGAWIGLGVTAAAVAGTVIYYFASSPTVEKSSRAAPLRLTGVAPWFGGGTQGFLLSGEF